MLIAITPTTNATTGAITAGISTFPTSPSLRIALLPTAAKTAPTTPPIRACDELEGNPRYQVARFQTIAPTRPANTTVGVIAPASTTSLATVAATASEMNAPAKLKTEA